MKKLSVFVKVAAVAIVIAVIIFLLTSGTASARGGHHGSGHRSGGGCLWAVPALFMAPFLFYPRVYTPVCYDRVVRQERYVRDVYGNFVRVPPIVVRECY